MSSIFFNNYLNDWYFRPDLNRYGNTPSRFSYHNSFHYQISLFVVWTISISSTLLGQIRTP
nr:MAG TPA: hypothetical protein [Caudoviricetes sp.]